MISFLPKSISEIASWGKAWKYGLSAVLVMSAAGLWLCSVGKVGDDYLWLSFLTGLSVLFVAATPVTDENWIKAHTTWAVMACVAVTALAAVCCPLVISVWAGYVAYTLATGGDYKILAAELCCVAEATGVVLS